MRVHEGQDAVANATDAASIQQLQAAQKELDYTRETLNDFQDMLFHKAEDVVQFYARRDFLPANVGFLEYHGFRWPTQISVASFYVFATILVPMSSWDGDIRSRSSIRHMYFRLNEHIRFEKENVEESDLRYLDGVVSIFNSCCDIVTAEQNKIELMSDTEKQAWLDDQDHMWKEAKTQFHTLFQFNSHAPIQQIRVIDDLAELWRMRRVAEEDSHAAMESAREAANRV